jgi:hypothetical protein
MRKVFIVLFILVTTFSYSQINFEKGYIINDTGNREDCLIKNIDWDNNPTEITYKFSETEEVKVATIQNIKEFGVGNHTKYIKFTVEIDRSSERLNKMSSNRNPEFKTETLLLKVLVEGEASLYKYNDNSLIRYFYKVENKPVKQLVYKAFMLPDNQTKGRNEMYKQQLLNSLKCSNISYKNIKALDYQKRKLISIFSKYNQCKSSDFVEFNKKKKKSFNINAKIGLNNSSFLIQNNLNKTHSVYFDNKLGVRVAVEVEYILPFNKNKWGIVLEPSYQTYKDEQSIDVSDVSGGKLISSVDYSSFEIPLGIRYYLFLNENSKLFVNAFFIANYSNLSKIETERIDNSNYESINVNQRWNLGFGVGYNYKKYSFEFRTQTPRSFSTPGSFREIEYKATSIILGYTIF